MVTKLGCAPGRRAYCVEIERRPNRRRSSLFGERTKASIGSKWFGERRVVGWEGCGDPRCGEVG